jgi:hypothetical protein
MVIRHETNKGYGGALQTIFSTARRMGVEELVIIDVGQHDPGRSPGCFRSSGSGNDAVLPSADSEAALGPTGKRRSRRSWPAGRSTPGFSPPTPT